MEHLRGNETGVSMLAKSITKIILAGVMAAAVLSPTLAAKMPKMPDACTTPEMRCTAECGKDGWCQVYGCIFNKTMLLPFSCSETAGGCLQKHC
jgi:hypothetical protein